MINAHLYQSKSNFPPGSKPLARLSAFLSILLLAAAIGMAEDGSEYHSCTVSAGGGATPITGSESSQLNAGWNFQAGGGFAVGSSHRWYITGDFTFNDLGVKASALQSASASNPTNIPVTQATGGRARFYTATLDPTYRFRSNGPIEPYLFAGFGWMRRDIALTGSNGGNSLLEPNNPVVVGVGGDSGAFDGGAGLNIRPWHKRGPTFYAEVRVLHGVGANKSATLIPISGGIRW